MKKLLFVNACIREHSRTELLSRRYIDSIANEYSVEEVKLTALNLKPFDAAMLAQRDSDIANGELNKECYHLAHQFAEADRIVIAAPYWDSLFPAVLRIYLEHICVTGITFAYAADGSLVKTCRAESLTYITTCGGYLPKQPAIKAFINETGALFSISDVHFYAAEGLDVYPDKVEEILENISIEWRHLH